LILFIYEHRPITTTVLIQAGHEGRTSGNTGSINGKYREVDWNIVVADEVAKILGERGIHFTRVGADIPFTNAEIAVAIHFDGSNSRCSTGASIGYSPTHHKAKRTALSWKRIYSGYFPFRWHSDNFTENLSKYYGFSRVNSDKGFIVLELGEITCTQQVRWLEHLG